MFENRAGDFDDVHGEAAGGALHGRVAGGDFLGEFDTHLCFKVGCDGDDDLVEQLGLAIRTLRRIRQEDVSDLAQKFAPLFAGSFLGEVEQKRKIVGGRRHAGSPLSQRVTIRRGG